ncbi:MAG: 16S rRNA (cytosine(967)-C(5))-methyltransferase RsmB [Lachnospiraceae bacterium]|nr:16S rRNA (cytosine(967)-C(5))-methyltransferase RsmB [Lachnospiraceae bacterium]
MNLRLIILETLLLIEKEDMAAGVVIKQVMDKYAYLDRQERSFLKRVLEGTIERRIELDYLIDQKSSVKTVKMKPIIRQIMRMSVYQLKYMDSVPSSAVCNEAVKLAVKKGMGSLKGFVNGVLRNLARDMDKIGYPDPDTPEGMSVKYSCPMPLVSMLLREQGMDNTLAILDSSVKKRDLYIRINLSKISREDLLDRLSGDDIPYEEVPGLPYALRLKDIDTLTRIDAFNEGLFTVQDPGSMLVTQAAGIHQGDRVYDVCAAPGGKSMHALDILKGTGRLTAFDLTEAKLELIRDNAARMGFENLDIIQADACLYRDEYREGADVLIADLPCSGIGVMGRKNDIKYNMTGEKMASLITLQRDILKNVSRYVKPQGTLVYSTCTIHKGENEDNFRWIEDNLPFKAESLDPYLPDDLKCDTSGRGYVQLIPGRYPGDGFFISRFIRV